MAILVKRWHVVFCKKAFWLVKDASASKDIAQESWQIIMMKLHTLENPNRFKSWALRIVYTKSLDALRAQQHIRLKKTEFVTSKISEVAVDDDFKDYKTALLKALKELPEKQQEVIKLFYTEDYSLKEISALLKISIGTAKSRLFHAREKLKLILKSQFDKI
ncbi:MAG: sigma-70 family RNA polymerase sigma factor [Algicola sp.]|nr:sigma-70 family RNA polymerase sigma factor [Algicola sp.]